MLEFKFDTQLLIEGHDLDEDAIGDYITEHYAEYNPPVVENDIGYCLKCGDGYFEYYAYVRMLHKEDWGVWQLFVENYFDDPELMAAYDELHPPKNAE